MTIPREMTGRELEALADRVAALEGPCREVDADIAEQALGWKLATIGKDYDGKNSCQVLTPDGKPYGNGYQYPPKGLLHRAWHVPQFTRDPLEAMRFMGLRTDGAYARSLLAAALRASAAPVIGGGE